MPFKGSSYTVNRAMYEVISHGCGYTGTTNDEGSYIFGGRQRVLLWLVLLRAVVDLFVVVYIPRRNNWAKQTARCLMKCASGPAFYQWKILLDYKSERNVTNHCLNRACNLLFWEVKLFHGRFVTTSASTSKLYAYNTSMGNSKSDASTLFFFPDYLRAQKKHGSSYRE